MNKPAALSNRERVARRRAALRAQGLRPKQFWVPDVNDPAVREQLHREAEAIAIADTESDIMAFIDSVSVWNDLPPYDSPLDE